MIRYENDCVDCASGAYPCRGSSCPLRCAKHFYCDNCRLEKDLYYFGEEELCMDCIIDIASEDDDIDNLERVQEYEI